MKGCLKERPLESMQRLKTTSIQIEHLCLGKRYVRAMKVLEILKFR